MVRLVFRAGALLACTALLSRQRAQGARRYSDAQLLQPPVFRKPTPQAFGFGWSAIAAVVIGGTLAAVAMSGEARAATVDCAGAATETVRTICDTAALRAMDEEVSRLSAPHADDPAFRSMESGWIRARDACRTNINCLLASYRYRLQTVRSQPPPRPTQVAEVAAATPQEAPAPATPRPLRREPAQVARPTNDTPSMAGAAATPNTATRAASEAPNVPTLARPKDPWVQFPNAPEELKSAPLADRLTGAVQALPPTVASTQQLQALLRNNAYQRPDLTRRQQERYKEAINVRIVQIRTVLDAEVCDKAAGSRVPRDLKGGVILLGLYSEPIVMTMCGAQAATGDARLTKPLFGPRDAFRLTAGDMTMSFKAGRLVNGTFVERGSPIKGGIPALAPTEVRVGEHSELIDGVAASIILTQRFGMARQDFINQAARR